MRSNRQADRKSSGGRIIPPPVRRWLLLLAAFTGTPAIAGPVFTGQWNGLVPGSLQILDDATVRQCREDLVRQCTGPVPVHRDGQTLVVEHRSNGLKWTYTPRPDGGYDAAYFRWEGEKGYRLLATAVMRVQE